MYWRKVIPVLVRGRLACAANFNFMPFIGIRISGPIYLVFAIEENMKQPHDAGKIYVQELVDEVVFPGGIELPEKTRTGVPKAPYGLELWTDFLCLAVGNPKITVEIQRPINVVMSTHKDFDVRLLHGETFLNLIYSWM